MTWDDRWVMLYAIPDTEHQGVFEALDAPTKLYFFASCEGTYSLDFSGKPDNLKEVEL